MCWGYFKAAFDYVHKAMRIFLFVSKFLVNKLLYLPQYFRFSVYCYLCTGYNSFQTYQIYIWRISSATPVSPGPRHWVNIVSTTKLCIRLLPVTSSVMIGLIQIGRETTCSITILNFPMEAIYYVHSRLWPKRGERCHFVTETWWFPTWHGARTLNFRGQLIHIGHVWFCWLFGKIYHPLA